MIILPQENFHSCLLGTTHYCSLMKHTLTEPTEAAWDCGGCVVVVAVVRVGGVGVPTDVVVPEGWIATAGTVVGVPADACVATVVVAAAVVTIEVVDSTAAAAAFCGFVEVQVRAGAQGLQVLHHTN